MKGNEQDQETCTECGAKTQETSRTDSTRTCTNCGARQ